MSRFGGQRRSWRRLGALAALAVALWVVLATAALAHVERTSYWPDPRPDTSVRPAVGGAVPQARSLASALNRHNRYRTRVVCQRGSMRQVTRAIDQARRTGFKDRATERLRRLGPPAARRLLRINRALWRACRYHQIQPAVSASGNHDRVVIMPGTYTEPSSRRVPAFPKQCDQYREASDHGSGAVSYSYQYHCPNAQALVAVIGRRPGKGQDPPSSIQGRPDPHGIPNLGPCIRCGLQIEGSGPSPADVIIDAGRVASRWHAPIGAVKDVGLKVDRADGTVLRDFSIRHAAEHDLYILEVDGYRVNRMKFFYAGEYGELMFTSDHGLTDTCEAVGNGDSGVYPGGAPDTGARRDTSYYPTARRNQTITHCDLHHNNMGTSGTMGNSVRYVDNNVYENGAGFVTDSFYAGGHPGFPEDSTVYENNRVYSNNFNVYGPGSDVKSAVPIPLGVGALIAGGDDNVVRNNYIYDNWRRGAMLIAVPDAISCAPNPDVGAPPCTPQGAATTSNGNRYYGNVMGRSPSGQVLPNGVDFWWDEFPSNTGNCWYQNTGPDGTPGSVTSDPAPQPAAGATLPGYLPQDCGASTNVGLGNSQKESVLAACAANFETNSEDSTVCDWFAPPPRPGPSGGTSAAPPTPGLGLTPLGVRSFHLPSLCHLLGGDGGTLTCEPFRQRLS